MKKITIILSVIAILITMGCKKDQGLTPARDVQGVWLGKLTSSDNNQSCSNTVTMTMRLTLYVNDKTVTGTMEVWPPSGYTIGNVNGNISGVNLNFTTQIGNGCINVHGTFTSTNMEGMKGSNPPPYLTCGDVLNDGHGSKGLTFQLNKK